MRIRVALLAASLGLCLGGSCEINFPDGATGFVHIPLDEARATILLAQTNSDASAQYVAEIEDRLGRWVEFSGGQAVELSGIALDTPDENGVYRGTVPAANAYTLTVREPTRGVETTGIAVPSAFAITAPAAGAGASLSGFTLSWSGADPGLTVEIALQQTFAGRTEANTVGPFADAGARALTAEDLREFVQGADLNIMVTRVATTDDLAGFAGGNVEVRRSVSGSVSPRP